jgi:hypothetical protein
MAPATRPRSSERDLVVTAAAFDVGGDVGGDVGDDAPGRGVVVVDATGFLRRVRCGRERP